MKIIGTIFRAGALAAAFGAAYFVQAQPSVQPSKATVGNTPMPGGVNQTPWFNSPQVRQQLKFNNTQFNGLNQAHQSAWTNYQKSLNSIDPNLPAAQRQQQIRTLQQNYYKNFNGATNQFLTDPAQRQRFNQLNWQYRGFNAFNDPTFANQMNLTADQRAKLNQYQQDWSVQMGKLAPMFQTNPAQAATQFKTMQTQNADRINSLLTPAQQATWSQSIGTPFTFGPDIYFPMNKAAPGTGNSPSPNK